MQHFCTFIITEKGKHPIFFQMVEGTDFLELSPRALFGANPALQVYKAQVLWVGRCPNHVLTSKGILIMAYYNPGLQPPYNWIVCSIIPYTYPITTSFCHCSLASRPASNRLMERKNTFRFGGDCTPQSSSDVRRLDPWHLTMTTSTKIPPFGCSPKIEVPQNGW